VPPRDDLPAALKEQVCAQVDALAGELLGLSHAIHAHPELSFEERYAAEHLTGHLRDAGLAVEAPAYGQATGFAADFGPEGSRVALLAEYDALPEIGHACGHNLIAAASVGAALALHRLGDALPGPVRLLGTPAEERGGGKALMAREGALSGIDAALMIHPAGLNVVDMPSLCVSEVEAVYEGHAAHAAAMPDRGVNALDALVLAYQSIAALRQHIRPSDRIHGIITEGGQAPNIVPERAVGRFFVRTKRADQLEALKARVAACFRAGAEATGARLTLTWAEVDYLDVAYNEPVALSFRANLERLDRRFTELDALPPNLAGSTDMGNVSHEVPAIHPLIAAAPPHVSIHHREFTTHAGGELGDRAALDGAKALAMTALDWWLDDALRERARAAFEARRALESRRRLDSQEDAGEDAQEKEGDR